MSSFLYEHPLARKQNVMTQLNNLHAAANINMDENAHFEPS